MPGKRCRAPGCENLTDRDICDSCDQWVTDQVALLDRELVETTPITTELRPRPLGRDGDQPPEPAPFLAPALKAVVNRGRKREPEGQSALPRFSPYAIPTKADPKAVDCPYCVRRPRNLAAHCRAVHPDKPEARR